VYRRNNVCGALAALASLLLPHAVAAQESAPTVTIVEGRSTIISGAHGLLPASGVRLSQCDIVHTGPQALMQIELEDAGKIVLGPDTRFLSDQPHGGEPVVGPYFMLSGWAKVTVPKRDKAPPYRINTPHFSVIIDAGVVALRIAADGGQFFVEQGNAAALENASGSRVPVGTGRTFSRKAEQGKSTLTDGVEATFAKGMPSALRDTLPAMLANVKSRVVQPKPAPDYSPANADEWLNADPDLRRCFVDLRVRSAQEALERNGFKVGPVDGVLGPRTQAALREFQQQRGLARSGQLDQETLKALDVADRR